MAVPAPIVRQLVDRVRRLAARMKRRLPAHVDLDDLVGAGLLGLSQALAHWEASDPASFDAYAVQRAMGAILDELRSYDELTRAQRRIANEITRAEHRLACELGRPPEEKELAERMGMTHESLLAARLQSVHHHRVSMAAIESSGPAAMPSSAPDTMLEEAQRVERLRGALDALPVRLRVVVDLSCVEELTLREIGERLGVTEGRACQLRKQAMAHLQRRCRDSARPPAPQVQTSAAA